MVLHIGYDDTTLCMEKPFQGVVFEFLRWAPLALASGMREAQIIRDMFFLQVRSSGGEFLSS